MIRLLFRLVLVLLLIVALLIGMVCCTARAVFGGNIQTDGRAYLQGIQNFILWLRDMWQLAREKLFPKEVFA